MRVAVTRSIILEPKNENIRKRNQMAFFTISKQERWDGPVTIRHQTNGNLRRWKTEGYEKQENLLCLVCS